jgi:transcriptional regulator with XRE-family HTH domain
VRLPDPAQARAIREASGVTAAEVASALGVSRTSVWPWEASAHRPRGERRDAYAEAIEELRLLAAGADPSDVDVEDDEGQSRDRSKGQ